MASNVNSQLHNSEINILILGETGVGKSTWINGFVNFLNYATLAEAEEDDDDVNLIPTSFTMTDANYDEITVSTGECDNENCVVGQSATQAPKTYRFQYGNHVIRLIDTPGIGDTRGISYDRENFRKIVDHLRNVDQIHGICILLKPNSARLTVMFQFCVKELLSHLHKDAAKNIVFCFTNARGTLYRPGETLPALRKLLEENEVSIELSKETIYCVNNESIRFLAAIRQGLEFDDDTQNLYSKSWERSVEETTRLIEHIEGLQPHKTKSTLTVNEARQIINELTEPLAQIAKNIDDNIAVLKEKEEELEKSKLDEEDLLERLYIPYIDLEPTVLPYPRTVCTSTACIKLYPVGDRQKVDYKECHAHCYLTGVSVELIPCPALRSCWAMNDTDNCQICSCSWESHITYENVQVPKQTIDESTLQLINGKVDTATVVEAVIQKLRSTITEQTAEKEYVITASSKFGSYLMGNAIQPLNDTIEEYLLHLIDQEKSKIALGGNGDTLKSYDSMLRAHKKEVEILRSADPNVSTLADPITADDISIIAADLYSLPLNGPIFKKYHDTIQATAGSRGYYHEIPCEVPAKTHLSKLTKKFKQLFSGKV